MYTVFSKEFDEDIGTTRVLIHTEKGKRIFHQIEGKIKYKSIDADMVVEGVREMLESPKMHPQRQYFLFRPKEASILVN